MKKKLIISIGLMAILALPANAYSVDPNFDPNFIIGDSDILNSRSMSYEEVSNFLIEKNSYLANYSTKNAEGKIQTAAQIIYNAAANNYDCSDVKMSDTPSKLERQLKCKPVSINPQFLLVLLQKEQSLIEDKTPRQSQLDWATGYGCPDGGGCNNRWKGFGKQVNSAALQFIEYMNTPQKYTYKAGNLYKFTNSHMPEEKQSNLVRPTNRATAALYNYTPHVYNGNYNFYNIWQRYFSRDLLEGSLVQIEGEPGVWLIKNGKRHPFTSKSALTSRFDENKILRVKAADLASYKKGGPLKFPQYSIVITPNGSIYLLVDNKKRKIVSDDAFKRLGYNPEELMDSSWEDIATYDEGAPISAMDAYPTGALLQNNETGGVYWVIEGTRSPIWDRSFLDTKFKSKQIVQVDPQELDEYTEVDPVLYEDGELLSPTNGNAVYIISGGKKRPITSGQIFEEMGFKWDNVIKVNPKVIYLYDEGEPVTIN